MKKYFSISFPHYTPALAVGVLVLLLLSSCFTGVESTKKIELSKEDIRQIKDTPEDTFLNQIIPTPHTEWEIGKKFFATDNRTALIFNTNHITSDYEKLGLGGKTLTFAGTDFQTMLDGSKSIVLKFSDGSNIFIFNTKQNAGQLFYSSEIPLVIDLDMVESAKQILVGLKLWTMSSLWYDVNGEKTSGQKFVPISIIDVLPGDKVFPIKVIFKDSSENTYSMLMNVGNSGIDSRSFANLFSLSDPYEKYAHIDSEIWNLIQNGQIRNGMTKEECRLSLGSPKEVNKGHNYSSTLELWQYTDGVYLQFQDGLLVNFRQ